MIKRIWILGSMGIGLIGLSGCALTQQTTPINQLQIKVAQLEKRLAEREQEIEELKYEMSNLAATHQEKEMDIEEGMPAPTLQKVNVNYQSSDEDTRIIRVEVSEQEVQQALKTAGYYDGTVDGKLGAKTKQAIADFQKDHGLKADGIVGKKTWAVLKNYVSQEISSSPGD